MQRDSGIEISNIIAKMHNTSCSRHFLTLHSPITGKKIQETYDLVELVNNSKLFVTSIPSLGPCLLQRGRNMAGVSVKCVPDGGW